MGILASEKDFGAAATNKFSSAAAPFRAEIDDVIRAFYYIQIMFYYNDGIALIHQPLQHGDEFGNVGKMQVGGRLIQDIKGRPRRAAA